MKKPHFGITSSEAGFFVPHSCESEQFEETFRGWPFSEDTLGTFHNSDSHVDVFFALLPCSVDSRLNTYHCGTNWILISAVIQDEGLVVGCQLFTCFSFDLVPPDFLFYSSLLAVVSRGGMMRGHSDLRVKRLKGCGVSY